MVVSVLTKQKKGTYSFHSVTFPLVCTSNGLHQCLNPKNLMKLSLQFRKSHVGLLINAVAEELPLHRSEVMWPTRCESLA